MRKEGEGEGGEEGGGEKGEEEEAVIALPYPLSSASGFSIINHGES